MSIATTTSIRGRLSFVRSIFFKSVLMMAVSFAAISGFLAYSSTQVTHQINSNSTMVFGDEILRHVANQTAPILVTQDADALSFLMDETFGQMNENATGLLVLGTDGSVLFEDSRGGYGTDTMRAEAQEALRGGVARMNNERLVVARPIRSVSGEEVIGAIAADWSTTASQGVVREAKTAVWLTILALAFALVFVCSWLFRTMLTKPLLSLANATKNLASGNFDLNIPAFEQGNELRPISSALTEFCAQMETSQKARTDAAMKNAALDAGSAAIMVADQDFKIVFASDSVTRLLNQHKDTIKSRIPAFNPDDIVGQTIDIFHKKPDMQRKMLGDLGAKGHDARLEMDDVTLELKISRIDDDEGVRIGYVVEWADVSEQYLNAAVLKSLNENQARAEFGPDGQLVDGNDAFRAMVGSEAAANGCCFSDTVFIDDAPADPTTGMFGEIMIKGADGAVSHLLGGLSPVTYVDGSLKRTVLLAADVTEEFHQKAAAEADRKRMQTEQDAMIEILSDALSKLADGDLTVRIHDAFDGSNEVIRQNFNSAVEKLDEAIDSVVSGATEIQAEVAGVASSAEDLSKRTENQAATLEKTATAVTQISASISSSAKGAKSTNDVVSNAKSDAQQSEKVVHDAVKAMAEITKSASEIQSIVKVIDDIAFQTNLLALNAGVEAARAGDAGLGFAVVASEVRALALRSSEAASEIGGLINSSTESVKLGSELVGNAGTALEQIIASISDISEYVAQIASASQEQSSSVAEISSAMKQLDQVTQQNAAMFEETTAASQNLSRVADDLTGRVQRFATVSKQPGAASWEKQQQASDGQFAARSA